MKKCRNLRLFCIFLSLFFFSLNAEIIEIQKIEEILPFVDDKTLVVLDIDDTLMVPAQMLGGDCWFRYTLKRYLESGFEFEEALSEILPIYVEIQNKLEVLPVEANTASVVHRLQEKADRVIGLTTRSNILLYRTIEQLNSLGIHLNKTALFDLKSGLATDYSLYYIDGILSTEARHKGEALSNLCARYGYFPEKIIFVNDKLKFVLDVEETFINRDVIYYGFRYAGSDEISDSWSPELSNVQKKYFNKILSDEDASKILEGQHAIAYD